MKDGTNDMKSEYEVYEIYCPFFRIDKKTKKRYSIYCEAGRISLPSKTQHLKYIENYCSSKENHTNCTLCKILYEHYNTIYTTEEDEMKKQQYFELTKDMRKGRLTTVFKSCMGYIIPVQDEKSGKVVEIAFRKVGAGWTTTHVKSGLKIREYTGTLEEAIESVKEQIPAVLFASKTDTVKSYIKNLEEYKKELIENETV